jgi:hypothetical protein
MKFAIDIDEDTLREAAAGLAESTTLLDDLSSDPKKLLSKLGVSIDDETAKRISSQASGRARFAKAPSGAAASIVHIDT